MRIGLVRRGYSDTGGAEAYLIRFANGAAAAGHECVLYTDVEWPAQRWSGETVTVEGRHPAAFAANLPAARAANPCDILFSLERVSSCDVYRAGDGVHAGWLQRRGQYDPAWKRWLRRWNPKHRAVLALESALLGERGARQVIANSRLVRKEISRHFSYPETRIEVIYNGVPPRESPVEMREATRAELGLDPEEYVALFAGSGWDRKGLRFAVEAIRRLGDEAPILLVAGRGDARPFSDCPRVRFLGPRSDMPRLLAAADVFVLPTIYDPFSNACLEALAAGLPVITSRMNGFSEIIDPNVEGDILARPDDIEALVFSLCAWADPLRRENIRPRLLAKGAEYSIERNVRETLTLLEKVRR